LDALVVKQYFVSLPTCSRVPINLRPASGLTLSIGLARNALTTVGHCVGETALESRPSLANNAACCHYRGICMLSRSPHMRARRTVRRVEHVVGVQILADLIVIEQRHLAELIDAQRPCLVQGLAPRLQHASGTCDALLRNQSRSRNSITEPCLSQLSRYWEAILLRALERDLGIHQIEAPPHHREAVGYHRIARRNADCGQQSANRLSFGLIFTFAESAGSSGCSNTGSRNRSSALLWR